MSQADGALETLECPLQSEPLPRSRSRIVRRRPAIALAVLIIVAAATAGWQYAERYRTDVSMDAQHVAVLAAARTGTVSILSYAPDTLAQDFATAEKHLTGDFLAYYRTFTEQVVRPAATEQKVTTTAEVSRAAVTEMHPDSATVLVFIGQTTTRTGAPAPAPTSSSLLVSLQRVGDTWLISGFDPT